MIPVDQGLGIVPQSIFRLFQIDAVIAELLGQRIGTESVAFQ